MKKKMMKSSNRGDLHCGNKFWHEKTQLYEPPGKLNERRRKVGVRMQLLHCGLTPMAEHLGCHVRETNNFNERLFQGTTKFNAVLSSASGCGGWGADPGRVGYWKPRRRGRWNGI